MSLPVHLVPSLDGVGEGDEVVLEGDEAHHAVAVRRLRVGEAVVLVDGLGATTTGEVTATGKRRLVVAAGVVTRTRRPAPDLVVVQALAKGERGELAVEVLTEVGVAEVVPWAAARSVALWRGERVEKGLTRWRATAREAAKQARRTWHPVITDLADLDAVLALVAGADLAVVLHEAAAHPLAGLDVPAAGRVVVVVGPEGGLSPEELAALSVAGAVVVRLGAEVLRTSTAGLAACSAILAGTGRWS